MRGTRRTTGQALRAGRRGARRGLGRRLATTLAAAAVAGGALGLAGCILRPEDPDARRRTFDRSELSDVLLSEVPPRLEGGGAVFADGIELAGWRMTPETPGPGDTVQVSLFWRVREGPQADWTVFVHLDPPGEAEGRRINVDHPPAGGRYPTGVWQSGEVVQDDFTFTIPRAYPASVLEFWVGLFRGDDRLEVENRRRIRTDGQDRVLAGLVSLQ